MFLLLLGTMAYLSSCKKDEGINLFTLEQDVEFGMAMNNEIMAKPEEFPILSEVEYPEAYRHIRRIRDSILKSPDLKYKEEFAWEVKIIQNDTVLNAFAVPGGYMYFYTGIIRFLDSEDQFTGVMAHEMAHVDKRHSTRMLTKQYGLAFMIDVLLGKEQNGYVQIASSLAQGLAGLSFSREHEYQADEFSVKYMYPTAYDARGVKGFFDKMEDSPQPPAFLSTHPSPEDRAEKILQVWQGLGGKEGQSFDNSYQQFKNSLPPVK